MTQILLIDMAPVYAHEQTSLVSASPACTCICSSPRQAVAFGYHIHMLIIQTFFKESGSGMGSVSSQRFPFDLYISGGITQTSLSLREETHKYDHQILIPFCPLAGESFPIK